MVEVIALQAVPLLFILYLLSLRPEEHVEENINFVRPFAIAKNESNSFYINLIDNF